MHNEIKLETRLEINHSSELKCILSRNYAKHLHICLSDSWFTCRHRDIACLTAVRACGLNGPNPHTHPSISPMRGHDLGEEGGPQGKKRGRPVHSWVIAARRERRV